MFKGGVFTGGTTKKVPKVILSLMAPSGLSLRNRIKDRQASWKVTQSAISLSLLFDMFVLGLKEGRLKDPMTRRDRSRETQDTMTRGRQRRSSQRNLNGFLVGNTFFS